MKNRSFTFLSFLQPSLGIRVTAASYRYDMTETSAKDHSPVKMSIAVPLDIPLSGWFSIQPELAFSQREIKSADRGFTKIREAETLSGQDRHVAPWG